MLVRPYALIICGCQSCSPLLTAVLPANTTLSVNTCLFQRIWLKLKCATGRCLPASAWSFASSQRRSSSPSHVASARPVAEKKKTGKSQQHRRKGFDDEHPLPPAQPKPPVNSEKRRRDRGSEEAR